MDVYRKPLYYSIAFSFVKSKMQADFFERLAKRYSTIAPKRFLDIACGPSPQLIELAKRGYECIGLDKSPEMLAFLRKEASKRRVKITTIRADLRCFTLSKKADFASVLMGSVAYATKGRDFSAHLNSVAKALNKGGLYVIENVLLDLKAASTGQKWTMKKGRIMVRTTYNVRRKRPKSNILEERLVLDVNDNGKKIKLDEHGTIEYLPAAKIKSVVKSNAKFEVVGFFRHFKLEKLKRPDNLNLLVLRRI